jgi:TPR repeat protein
MRTLFLALACFCVSIPGLRAHERDSTPILGDAPLPDAPAAPPVPGDQQTFAQGTAAYDARDYARAYQTFLYLADHDDIAAMRNVGLMKRLGQGTPRDPKGAIEFLTQAAEAGLPTAENDLGEMLLNGEAGPADPTAALPWLEAAAKAHHPVAAFRLAEIYEGGRVVPRDVGKAEQFYAEAAERGVPQAATRLNLLRSGAVSSPRP